MEIGRLGDCVATPATFNLLISQSPNLPISQSDQQIDQQKKPSPPKRKADALPLGTRAANSCPAVPPRLNRLFRQLSEIKNPCEKTGIAPVSLIEDRG